MINRSNKSLLKECCWRTQSSRISIGSDNRRALTLVEMLVATALTLIMMALVARLFGMLGKGVNGSRNRVELYNRVRATGQRLRQDLSGLTVSFKVPISPEEAVGYFEYIEGPETEELSYGVPNPADQDSAMPFNQRTVVLGNYWPPVPFGSVPTPPSTPPPYEFRKTNRSTQSVGNIPPFDIDGDDVKDTAPGPDAALLEYIGRFDSDDRIVGDVDDVLLFTTRSNSQPFAGKLVSEIDGKTVSEVVKSSVAEVIWYCRLIPNTFNPRQYNLYRRQRIVMGNPAKNIGTFSSVIDRPDLPQTLVNVATVDGDWQKLEKITDISCRMESGFAVPNSLGDLTKRENRFCHELYDHPDGGPLEDQSAYIFNPKSTHLTFQPLDAREGEDLILSNCIGFDVRIFDHTNPTIKGDGTSILVPGSPGYSEIESPVADLFTEVNGSFVPMYGDLGFGGKLASGFMYAPDNNRNRLRWPTYDTWSTTDSYDNMPYKERARGIEVRIRCFEPASKQVIQLSVQETFEHE